MSRYYIRLIFISVFIFLPIQYVLVGVVGSQRSEPWPTFVFPGFKTVYHSAETVSIITAEFQVTDAEGHQFILTPAQVFSEIPVSHHSAIMRYQFKRFTIDREKNVKFFSDEGWEWLSNQIIKSNPEIIKPLHVEVVWFDRNFEIQGLETTLIKSVEVDRIAIEKNSR